MDKFSAPFMAKSPVDEKKRLEKLREKVEMARRKAFIKSKSKSEEFEGVEENLKDQEKYKKLKAKLDKLENK
jgi:hypothetical protein|tara:strand:- start:812 stop:1027 length:216 start_codon:yes stop_codon:yes gene_type:complete